ncbi:hypothetical protein TNCV_4543621 [Trichonephila clavipes]|nr:hypothetical protein TNCV_4543621 [Trichonephila clavipes]
MISSTCSTGDRSGDLAGQGNVSTLYRAHCVTAAITAMLTIHLSSREVMQRGGCDRPSRSVVSSCIQR